MPSVPTFFDVGSRSPELESFNTVTRPAQTTPSISRERGCGDTIYKLFSLNYCTTCHGNSKVAQLEGDARMPLLSNDIQLKIQNFEAHWTQQDLVIEQLTECAITRSSSSWAGSGSQNYALWITYVHRLSDNSGDHAVLLIEILRQQQDMLWLWLHHNFCLHQIPIVAAKLHY